MLTKRLKHCVVFENCTDYKPLFMCPSSRLPEPFTSWPLQEPCGQPLPADRAMAEQPASQGRPSSRAIVNRFKALLSPDAMISKWKEWNSS